jgi:hypothetical protein
MKILQALMWMLAGVLVLGLMGCSFSLFGRGSSPHASAYVGQPQPEYVIVREAPPSAVREHRPDPPSRRHIWIEGYWHWDGRRYVWDPGHWAVPPRERAVWVAPRYEKDKQGYRYTPGRWRED